LKDGVKKNHSTAQPFGAYSLKTIASEQTGISAMANSQFNLN